MVSQIGPLAGTSPKAAGLVNRRRSAVQRQAKGGRARRVGATPSAVRAGIALGVIDQGPAANGVDLAELRDTEVKMVGDW